MPRGMQRSNREVKKPKKDKPKQTSGGFKSETATLMASTSKESGDKKKTKK